MESISAVLTGDLIGSTKAAQADVETTILCISKCFRPANLFTRFRGDGWQAFIPIGGKGLWEMLRVSAKLRAEGRLDSRISLGLGTATVGTELASAHGEAFIASGRALAGMPKKARFAVDGQGVTPVLQALVQLIDDRMQSWSHEQTEAAALAMDSVPMPTQQEIADRLGISRQAVAARFASAGFSSVASASWAFYQEFHGGSWTDA